MATATQTPTEVSDAFMPPSANDVQKSTGLVSNEHASPIASPLAFPHVDKHDLPDGHDHAQVAFFVELQSSCDNDASSFHKLDNHSQDVVDRDDTELSLNSVGASVELTHDLTVETEKSELLDSPVVLKNPPGLHAPDLDTPLVDPATPPLCDATTHPDVVSIAEATQATACVEYLTPMVDASNLSEKADILPPMDQFTIATKTIGSLDGDGENCGLPAPTFILHLTPSDDDASSVNCDDTTSSPDSKAPLGLEEASQNRLDTVPSSDVESASPGLVDESHPTPEKTPESATLSQEEKATAAAEAHILEVDPAKYSLDGLEPLETFIPAALLPDELVVHDLRDINGLCDLDASPRTAAKYVRRLPARNPSSADGPPRVAHLYLRNGNCIGKGHHGAVFAAPMRLLLDPEAHEQSVVRVAAKTAFGRCGAHEMLRYEALVYNAFPPSIMETTTVIVNGADDTDSHVSADGDSATPPPDGKTEGGPEQGEPESAADPERGDLQVAPLPVTPEPPAEINAPDSENPTPAVRCTPEANGSDEAKETQQLRLVPAIVPKFYGYYKPVDEGFASLSDMHPDCDRNSTCDVSWPTRILLLEECGTTVDPFLFTKDQRNEIVVLLDRLHDAGFMQGSAYTRNFLVQPGPLTLPRAQRSMEKPSFRIIDFGRAEAAKVLGESSSVEFYWKYKVDIEGAQDALDLWD